MALRTFSEVARTWKVITVMLRDGETPAEQCCDRKTRWASILELRRPGSDCSVLQERLADDLCQNVCGRVLTPMKSFEEPSDCHGFK